jgi:tRNA nucleotidyltransferase (CCA-adding enzyme)
VTIEYNVLERIRPPHKQREELDKIVKELIGRVKDVSSYFKVEVEAFVAGSVAKDTHLKDPDVDLFILFSPDTPLEVLRERGLDIARSIVEGEEKYAQHPYLRGNYKGFEVDLVPAYKLKDTKELMTAVDRTPFHVRFIQGRLQDTQKNEVRLLKQFLKGIDAYGAEEAVQGFSGYLVELLVLRFGSFHGALRGLANYTPGNVLHLFEMMAEEDRPSKEEIAAFEDPMIFIDPVDARRNVASPIAIDTLGIAIQAAREYLAGPMLNYFFPNPAEALPKTRLEGLIRDRETKLIGMRFPIFHENPDVVHGQLRKALRVITRLANRSGFPVMHSAHYVAGEECLILIEFEVSDLPTVEVHHGPRLGAGNEADFIERWASDKRTLVGPYVEDGNWRVDILRIYPHVEDLLQNELPNLNLGKQLSLEVAKGLRILDPNELLKEGYLAPVTQFYLRTPPWRWGEPMGLEDETADEDRGPS